MTREEKKKAIDALKISAPIMAVTQEEFKDYIQTLNKVMDWLEQEPILDKIKEIVNEWQSDTWTDNLSYECMVKIAELVEPQGSREFIEIVVEYPPADSCVYPEYKGKPYFSIKYRENGKTHVGFGTYKIEILSQWIKEYFISNIQPKTRQCKNCKWWKDSDGVYRRSLNAESRKEKIWNDEFFLKASVFY